MATRKRMRAPGSTDGSRALILYEDLETRFQRLHEGMFSIRDSLERSFNERFDKLGARIELLGDAVRMNSEDIRKNSEDIRKLQRQVEELTQVVAPKVDERADRLS